MKISLSPIATCGDRSSRFSDADTRRSDVATCYAITTLMAGCTAELSLAKGTTSLLSFKYLLCSLDEALFIRQ